LFFLCVVSVDVLGGVVLVSLLMDKG
jgi:hypothetical protein